MNKTFAVYVVAIALAATPAVPAFSQSPFGTLLNGLTGKSRGTRDPFGDMQTQTVRLQFALRNNQLVFIGAEPGERLNENRQSCISSLNSNSGGVGAISSDLSSPQPILKNDIYQSNERIMRNGNEYRLFTRGCGPISTAPGSAIDTSNEAQFRAVGVDVAMLASDANAYIQQLQHDAAANTARKQAQAEQQAKLDTLWLQADALYLANGELYGLKTDQYMPFQTNGDCKAATVKKRSSTIIQGQGSSLPIGESVIGFSDGSGWQWFGCALVKDYNSGAFAKYMDQRMTAESAKSMKLIPAISAPPLPSSQRGQQTKF